MTHQRDFWSFFSAGRIVFGTGSVKHLGELLQPWQPRKVLIVTDAALQRAGVLTTVEIPLRNAGIAVEVFHEGEPEPSFAIAEKAPYPHNFMELIREDVTCEAHDIQQLSIEAGTVKVSNVMVMGLLAKHLDIDKALWIEVIKETVPEKFLSENLLAFDMGTKL